MAVHDTIGDFITVIRNAGSAGKATCEYPHSNLRTGIATILRDRGFVEKISEIGVKKIVPLFSEFSSRIQININRFKKISIEDVLSVRGEVCNRLGSSINSKIKPQFLKHK